MNFGNILGQLLEQGMSGQSQTQARLGTSARNVAQGGQAAPGAQLAASAAPLPEDVAAVTSEEAERLALRAMIAAAKADGQIHPDEMDRLLGHMNADDVTEAERKFVLDEIRKSLDPSDLAKDVHNPAQAAEVYAASLLAIDVDSEAERAYLRNLAAALRLDAGVVSFLHQTTGAPAA